MSLFAYWDSLEGGREGAMVDRELRHVFEILSHTRGLGSRIYLEVIWVESPKSSCEPEATIRDADNDILEGYWKSQGGRKKALRALRGSSGPKGSLAT
ncbi:hypothetical protein BDP55DRAFT_682601 [Colletotrichum godetiae]|uniref:Uncharacterized protein n=1 Tax=Colletotrichum godetiae TaxID=1209918 RepID=A0AAJ0A8Q6_9PEZI|nr:uncharacterized protein BDP55DRAFT_682601 [Colletotrichum godetiae]KAK1658565.1 hypothetical protein BDP55DRAFT_682601 [Colletotrichum godetiae]